MFATGGSTKITGDGSRKLSNTHHSANPLSVTKNTVTTALLKPHDRSFGTCCKSSASTSRQPAKASKPLLHRPNNTTNSYLTENDHC
jgi:hypothetical protein